MWINGRGFMMNFMIFTCGNDYPTKNIKAFR